MIYYSFSFLIASSISNNSNHLFSLFSRSFSKILNFPRSSFIVIENNKTSDPKKYWKPKININNKLSYNESVEIVKSKLIDSTKMRLRSDFPITCLLSGGIDSSAISGISKKICY